MTKEHNRTQMSQRKYIKRETTATKVFWGTPIFKWQRIQQKFETEQSQRQRQSPENDVMETTVLAF